MTFAARSPSAAWEPLRLPADAEHVIWAWFRPGHAPEALLLQVPEETRRACGSGLTMRHLLAAAGIDFEQVAAWTLQGVTYDAAGGTNPLLDRPVPSTGDAGILVHLRSSLPSHAG